MRYKQLGTISFLLTALLTTAACQPIQPMGAMQGAVQANFEPREIQAWAGGGQDTNEIAAFLPETLHIRAGDTVTWQLDGAESHFVTLLGESERQAGGFARLLNQFIIPLPDGQPGVMFNPMAVFPSRPPGAAVETHDGSHFANSGQLSHNPAGPDAPPNDHFSLTFTTPGTYEVRCYFHPWMVGTVVVHPANDTQAPSQEEITAQAESERAAFLAEIEVAIAQGEKVRSQPGPTGNTIWHVRAGNYNVITGDERAETYGFLPKELTINVGDTVIWDSVMFHTVTFDNAPPRPEPVIVQPVEGGLPLIIPNPEVFLPAEPSGIYDPAQYHNSGDIGPYSFNSTSWSLTFDQPGTYSYFCGLHGEFGMEGTIVVK